MITSSELTAPVHSTHSPQFQSITTQNFLPADKRFKKSGSITFTSSRLRAAQSNRTFCIGMSHSCTMVCSSHEHMCLLRI